MKRFWGIRVKFLGILVLSSALPLILGLISIQILGNRYYEKEKGRQFQAMAQYVASSIDQLVAAQFENLNNWATHSDLAEHVVRVENGRPLPDEYMDSERVSQLENRWKDLSIRDPELASLLINEASFVIKHFQSIYPLFAEVLITDEKGRLIAASNKTEDYWQADEEWWQKAISLGPNAVWMDELRQDPSAGVYAMSVCIPIRTNQVPSSPVIGVIKGVMDVSPVLASIQPFNPEQGPQRHIVRDDGRVLARLCAEDLLPDLERMNVEAMAHYPQDRAGWMVSAEAQSARELVGFCPLFQFESYEGELVVSGVKPIYVVVHRDLNAIMAPIRSHLWTVTGFGALVIFGFLLSGIYIANRKIIDPLHVLSHAAQSIAASARLKQGIAADESGAEMISPSDVALRVSEVHSIVTGDEMEDLARDFCLMSDRVLRYHEQLEMEIAEKTEEIQRDLTLAREFQEAILQREYPKIPSPGGADALSLNFHHVYKPALSVGGDFFDVSKLSDHRAGIVIADVMGHGARSALITSVLRALLQNVSRHVSDPGKLLQNLNRHFVEIVPQNKECIFASMFYLVVDTAQQTATFASAGHPSPLFIDGTRRLVTPLMPDGAHDPAIGLFNERKYRSYSVPIKAGDMILLFTDGAVEAPDPKGREFGEDRLLAVVNAHLKDSAAGVVQAVTTALHRHMDTVLSPDDICMVAVEVQASMVSTQSGLSAYPSAR